MPEHTQANGREAQYPIDPMFLERWSPRAFSGEVLPEEQLLTMLEAAHWAPSSYNSQPARFLYALKESADWDRFFNLLVPFNQSWVKDAGALVIIVSESTMIVPGSDKPVPSPTHSFDTGCAWGYLALQAWRSGWYAHGMVGFDMEKAFAELDLPMGFRVEAAIAIGKIGDKSKLPDQLREREVPSGRKPLSEVAFAGSFKK